MVSSVTGGTYYSYLNQLQGGAQSSASAQSGSQSLVSSLLNNNNAFSPSVLSLVQQNSSGDFDPISSLLGGSSPNHAITSLYSNLYASVSASFLTQAQDIGSEQAAEQTPQANPIQNLISQLTQASIAYNKTLQQNAAAVLKANSGVIPLVA